MKYQAGFSLIELLLALSIIAIIMAITVPGVIGWLPSYELKAVAGDMLSNAQKAKIMAVKNHNNCIIRFDETGGNITGYTLFIDEDRNFEYNPDSVARPFEQIVTTVSLADNDYVSITGNTFDQENDTGLRHFGFRPNGLPIADDGFGNGAVDFTNTKGKTTSVVVNVSGNVRID